MNCPAGAREATLGCAALRLAMTVGVVGADSHWCVDFDRLYCGTVMTVPYGFPSRAGGTAPADQPGQPPKVGSLRNPSNQPRHCEAAGRGTLLIRRTNQERAEDKHRSWPPLSAASRIFAQKDPRPFGRGSSDYFAYSTALVSRMTLTLIWPGYSSSASIFLAMSRARRIMLSSVTTSGLTMMRISRPAWMA